MFNGYLALGGLEVANNARVIGYAESSSCPLEWFVEEPCQGFLDSVGLIGYDIADISSAPWYDPDEPTISGDFLGVFITLMENLSDSTRSAEVTQKILTGGRIGTLRDASRSVRVQVLLSARSEAALEAGKVWLDAALTPGACGSHGTACGTTDLAFFDDCPPERIEAESDDSYNARVDDRRRFLHSVACVSGPFTVQNLVSSDGIHRGRIMEFTIEAEVPYVYGVTRPVSVPLIVPTVLEDVVFNYVPFPSAELAGADVIVSQNYSTNPSLETNATGWSATTTGLLGASVIYTSGRVTGELAAVGTAAWRSRVLGNGGAPVSNVAGQVIVEQTVPLAVDSGRKVSFSIWGAGVNQGGASSGGVTGMQADLTWMNGSTPIGSPISIDVADVGDIDSGVVMSLASQAQPPVANGVRVRVIFDIRYYASTTPANNSDIRLYVDALGVMVP